MKKFLLALLLLGTVGFNRSLAAPPDANGQSVTVAEDGSIEITLSASGNNPTYTPGTAAHGTLTLKTGSTDTYIYAPDLNYNGPDAFTFTATDDTGESAPATVSITVTPVNDAPQVNSQSVTVTEDGGVDITLSGSDVDGDALTFMPGTVAHGTLALKSGTIYTYTPAANYNGNDQFSFTANDGTVDSEPAIVTITVTAVNDAPVAANGTASGTEDGGAITGSVSATDVDGDALTYSLVSGVTAAQGTLTFNANGSYSFTPVTDLNGTVTFTYKANDGTANSNTATVTITVTPVNDAPTFTLIGSQTVAENAGAQSVPNAVTNMSAGPSNEASQQLTLSVSNNNNSLFSSQPQIDATTGTLTYKSAIDASGQATVTVTLKDDGGTPGDPSDDKSTTKTFIITVTPVFNAADRSVILNEVYSNPGSGNNEFFELYNTSTNPTPIQLDCYTLVVYYKSKTASGFFVIDLPQSTISAKSWYIGASASTINVQGQGGISANFNWSNIGATGYIRKYKSNGNGYTDVTNSELKTAADFNDIFQPIQGGGDIAVFLFNQGSYVNGFMVGLGSGTNVPSQITGMPNLPVSFANTSACGSGFTINWAGITNAEFNTGGGAAGSDNGYARAWDGNCGSWIKTSSQINHTPGKSNNKQGAVQKSILTTSQNIICGTRLEYSVSSSDASVFPLDVRIYEDVNKNGLLDLGDVLVGDPIMITSSSTQIRTVTGLDPAKTYLVVYNTALGCSDAILAPNSTPGLTTTQYNYCNKQVGVAITAADQVALAEAFPVTVKFYNGQTQIGSGTINTPSSTIVYSDILTTDFTLANIKIQLIPNSSSCLSTNEITAANSTFTAATGTLQTNEQFVHLASGSTYPGKVQAQVTGITSTTGFTAANILPVNAVLYYENDPNTTADDAFIESYTFTVFSSTYHVFDHVFTYEQDNGRELKVVYTPQLGCPAMSRSVGAFLSPLPVTFKRFTAVRKDESKVALNWTTATEQNNRGFHVQRNTGSGWQNIAFVFSAAEGGNSNQELSYSYTDVNLTKGASQYRILQVDLSGSGHYSETRAVNGSIASGKLMLFPNPSSTGSVTLLFDADGTKNIVVSDASGRLVQQFKNVMGNSLVIRNLGNGFFTVRVQEVSTGVITTEKFIIMKR